MTTNIIATQPTLSKPFDKAQDRLNLWQPIPAILIIRTFDRKGEWMIEVVFEGGVKATTSATADEVSIIESDLSDRGWLILPSLFSNGFSAKPVEDDCGMIFASSAGLWPDDYAIEPVTL